MNFKRPFHFLLIFLFLMSAMEPVCALVSIKEKTSGMKKYQGFFPFYWDEQEGKIWLEVDKLNEEFLYYNAISAGMGSNDIGLDRGRLGPGHVVKFVQTGPKVLLIEPNQDYRAISDNPEEVKAVEEAFAQSVLWGFTAGAAEKGKVLIDMTDFLLQDAFDAISWIKSAKQGNFKVDKSRSAFFLPMTKNFPENSEFESTLTYITDERPGEFVRSVTPSPNAITIRQHFSFVKLPDNNYTPREFDPRSGMGYISYFDFATPVDQPIEKRYIRRHRLNKKDPAAEVSEAVKPIIYYLDPGTPEPIRSALLEGTSWWNQAFEAAGYKNAFQVKMLPEGADPLDIRYNYIQWVHRSSRGWSYGGGVTDPRTGEIIKGKVTLGSLRIRQDFLIAQGLVGDFQEGKPATGEMMEMALARIRQLAAHEVGHTLGMPHNYASNYNDRASVMDYPHPMVKITDGKLDLSEAYSTGIGDWDKIAINFAYRQFPEGINEKEALNNIVADYIAKDIHYLTDQDGRPEGSAHPYVHLWDNGKSAAEELKHMLKVRKIALDNFSENKIPVGQPYATLEEVLVPVYLYHRYQTEATCKTIGGLYYNYSLRGDGQEIAKMVPAKEQLAALDAVMLTLEPKTLAVPEKLLSLIPPRPYGYSKNFRETFDGKTGLTFDPLAAAEASSDMTLRFLLQHERAARMIQYSARDNSLPGFDVVLDKVIDQTWKSKAPEGFEGEVYRIVGGQVLAHMMKLVKNEKASGQVRATTALKVGELKSWIASRLPSEKDAKQKAHLGFALSLIEKFDNSYEAPIPNYPSSIPEGAPIGSMMMDENFLGNYSCDY